MPATSGLRQIVRMSIERPAAVPSHATFNQTANGWEAGARDEDGKKIGQWDYWRPDGSPEGQEQWGDGRTAMSHRRFHPDGSIAQSGAKDLRRDLWQGTMYWTKREEPSPEDRFWPAGKQPNLCRYELTFDDDGWVIAEQFFDREGNRVTPLGAPFPERPEGVTAHAYLVNLDESWLVQTRSIDNQKRRGDYRVWDRNGVLQERHHYEDNGDFRKETFRSGALWSTLETRGADKVQTFYRQREGEPVISSCTVYRGGDNDREITVYDKQGQRLYSARMEEVAPGHLRRYYDGQLVFEAIWQPTALEEPPGKVEYYGAHGELLVDYQPLGGGRGELRLHKDGVIERLPVTDEAKRNKYGQWGRLLPGFGSYNEKRAQRDWEGVEQGFRAELDQHRFQERVAAQPIPEELAPLLNAVSWDELPSAIRGARIDRLLAMMVSAGPEDAARAREEIWGCVEQQDCVFPASYAAVESLAGMVPLIPSFASEGAERRVLGLLAETMCLPAMPGEDPDRFAEVAAAVREVAPSLVQALRSADEALGHQLLHLLSVVGEPAAIVARLRDQGTSVGTRAFAACAIVSCRDLTAEQRAEMLELLRGAFVAEEDAGVKVVLGLLVKLGASQGSEHAEHDEHADDRDAAIDAQLAHFLLHPAERPALYEAWRPVVQFLGDDISSMLMRAVPSRVRRRQLDGLLDRLPSRGVLHQVEDLDILFTALFPDGAAQELTPLHRRALRVAADLVDAHPGFVNHGEIYHRHGLPWSSFELRQLASAGEPA